ncbi:hypothetical protein QYF61_018187 [Mycteria americana]|uniref:Uncharacterized protein n=1 Tax=Mycteria americana TaxID=33587 RepID=A0AAN7RG36_MYCAM|nr:hypothetical protein QYF61_018187 [Mycteria americana]
MDHRKCWRFEIMVTMITLLTLSSSVDAWNKNLYYNAIQMIANAAGAKDCWICTALPRLSWFSPSQQLSTTQLLAHSPPGGMGERIGRAEIHLRHSSLSSLIHLLVVLMFLSGPTLGYFVLQFQHVWHGSTQQQCDFIQATSTNQLMDGNQGVSVGAILPPVHRCGSNWHLLFFDPQQPHNRRVL